MSSGSLQEYLPKPRAIEHDAIRILAILHVFGVQPRKDSEVCREMGAEYHIQKVDFFLRSPDFLAEALMDRAAKAKGNGRDPYIDAVRMILSTQEPDLRRIPMQKLFHGAYENLTNVEQYLTARGLIRRRPQPLRAPTEKRRTVRTRYQLTNAGCELVKQMLAYPAARWYYDRCALMLELLGRAVPEFKRQQYQQEEYVSTPLQGFIPSIADRVRDRARTEFGIRT